MEEKVFSLFIKNFPLTTTEQQLSEKFSEYGKVKSVRIICNESGQCRGFGFLDYENEEDMNRAISSTNDTNFNGNKIKVERARSLLGDPPRSKRQAPSRQLQDYRYQDRYRDPRVYPDYAQDYRRYPDPYSQPPNYRYRDEIDRPSYRDGIPRYRNDYPMNSDPSYRKDIPRHYDRYRDDRFDELEYPQQRSYRNYQESMNESSRSNRRIRDDSPPMQRRIVDNYPPPPPKKIVDDEISDPQNDSASK